MCATAGGESLGRRRPPVPSIFARCACAASELSTDVSEMCTHSELMSAACTDDVVAAQQLHSFSRGSVNIKSGSWVAAESASEPGESYICQISEIVQLFTHEAWHIRMLVRECIATPSASEGVWMSVPVHEMTG